MSGRTHTTTGTLADSIVNLLKEFIVPASVRVITSKDISKLFYNNVDVTKLPAAFIIYGGSEYKGEPNRTSIFSILLVTKNETSSISAVNEYFELLDNVITAFDYKIDGNIKYTVRKDTPIQIEENTNLQGLLIDIEVEDN